MDTEKIKRIFILNIPIDILEENDIEHVIKSMFQDGRNHQIVLLSIWDLMKARRSSDFRTMLNGASLVIPLSLSLVKASKFLYRTVPKRYMPFQFIIKIMNILDHWNKTLYILGGTKKTLAHAEKNIKRTFPNLRIVGRHTGFYSRQLEPSIIEAIRKSSPTLLLVGSGVNGQERWISKSMKFFNTGMYLWCPDLIEIFAEQTNKPSPKLFELGLEWLPYTIKHPLKIFRLFEFIAFKILLLVSRLRISEKS